MTQAAMGNDTMVAELLPCPSPWCDHRAYVASTDDDAFYGKAFQGRCTQCGLGGPVKRTEAEAVTAWNTRHQSGRTGAGEALREALETIDRIFSDETLEVNNAIELMGDTARAALADADTPRRAALRRMVAIDEELGLLDDESTAGEDGA